jgi:methionine synthase II (cobalamin-independent)
MKVYILFEVCEADIIVGVYSSHVKAVERAREIAERFTLKEDDEWEWVDTSHGELVLFIVAHEVQ